MTKYTKTTLILFILAIGLAFQNAEAQETKVYVPDTVLGNGGTALNDSSSTERFVVTIGQPVIGVMNGSSNINKVGFWHIVISGSTSGVIEEVAGDTTGDGVVNVADLVRLINVIPGLLQFPPKKA